MIHLKTKTIEDANNVAKLYYKDDACERLELRDRILEVVKDALLDDEPKESDICDVVIGNYYLVTQNDDGIYEPSMAINHLGRGIPYFKFLNGSVRECKHVAAYKLLNCN